MSELMSMLGMQKPKIPSYSFASMMMSGPIIKADDKTKGKSPQQIAAMKRREKKIQEALAAFGNGEQLTAREFAIKIGKAKTQGQVGNMCDLLNSMRKLGLVKVIGTTKAGHRMRAKNIWVRTCTQ